MKKIKIVAVMLASLMTGSIAFAQNGLELTLKYNSESEKYEVYAKPNFTKRNFLLGPSQITLVLPVAAKDEKLRVFTSDGGTWEDNTYVFSPKAKPDADFHAMSTLGAKTDLIDGNESLLFYFSLPYEINPLEVKLFENHKDPNSSAAGMKGGDFSNSINDEKANEVYLRNYTTAFKNNANVLANEPNLSQAESEKLILYPNTTKDDFNLLITGLHDSEEVDIIISTEMGKEIMKFKTTKSELEKKTFKIPADVASQNLVVRAKIGNKVFGRKLILERE